MRRWLIPGIIIVLTLSVWGGPAEAARSYTITQTPAMPALVTMGSTGTLTYRITNTNSGGNAGERIYQVRFRLPGTGTTFSGTTAAPAGWTRTAYSTTSVTFRAASWGNAIVTGAFLDFPIVFVFRSTTVDTNETLRDIRAYNTTTTTGPPFTNLGSVTTNNPGSWTLKSLEVTSVQITDLTGTPITLLTAGTSFRLVMTVRNRSTATQTSIVSNPNPPTAVKTGTVTQTLTSTVYSPSPLTLAAGASGTITFTYSTLATDTGTIYFTAPVRNNTGTATSATATSPTLTVGIFKFTASITVSSSCRYSGQSFTVTMTLTNTYVENIINVTPTLSVSLAGAPLTLTSGPSPAAPNGPVPASGGTFAFTWVYAVTAAANGEAFTFDGTATGTGAISGTPRTTPASSSPSTKAGGYLVAVTSTNASSTNDEISWTFQNNGCAATNSVAIPIPAGWTWSGDTYSLVDSGVGTSVETWTVSGSNPVVFTAPVVADQQYVGGQGEYRLTFSTTPTATGPNAFTLTITDANGYAAAVPTSVTVNPFNTGGLNDVGTTIWQEQYR